MNFLIRAMRYLFWVLVLSWSVALLRRTLGWMLQKAMAPAQADQDTAGSANRVEGAQDGLATRRLVRDPVCGTHVAEVLAIPLRERGELMHFCSVACRDKYTNSTRQMAANG